MPSWARLPPAQLGVMAGIAGHFSAKCWPICQAGRKKIGRKKVGRNEKSRSMNRLVERATGVEPASEAWEASILPMNYARRVVARSESSTASAMAHPRCPRALWRTAGRRPFSTLATASPAVQARPVHSARAGRLGSLSAGHSVLITQRKSFGAHHSALLEESVAESDEVLAEALDAAADAEALADALASVSEYSRKISAELASLPSGR